MNYYTVTIFPLRSGNGKEIRFVDVPAETSEDARLFGREMFSRMNIAFEQSIHVVYNRPCVDLNKVQAPGKPKS